MQNNIKNERKLKNKSAGLVQKSGVFGIHVMPSELLMVLDSKVQ